MGCSLFTSSLLAETEDASPRMTMTPHKAMVSSDMIPSSSEIIPITNEMRSQYNSVTEVLSQVSGFEVYGSSRPSSQTSVFVRGTNSGDTLVLMDGVELNDPSSPNRSFDFSTLNLDDIDRIEIVKGSSSVLYGSDAAGSIIHLFTKKNKKAQNSLDMNALIGSYNTTQASILTNVLLDEWKLKLLMNVEGAEGVSAANEEDGNTEKDGYSSWGISLFGERKVLDDSDFTSSLNYKSAEYDLDRHGGVGGDDPNYRSDERKAYGQIGLRSFSFLDRHEVSARLSFFTSYRHHKNEVDENDKTELEENYDSLRYKVELQDNFFLSSSTTLTTGLEYETEEAKVDNIDAFKGSVSSLFLQVHEERGRFFGTAGARLDQHSNLDKEVMTYKISPGYKVGFCEGRIFASYGTGFKNPSLFNLYHPSYGNSDLKAEKSTNWDTGFEFLPSEKIKIKLGYFETHYKNLIQAKAPDFNLENVGRSNIKGVDANASFSLSNRIAVDMTLQRLLNYKNETENNLLIRRARDTGSLVLRAQLPREFQAILSQKYVGKRIDYDAEDFSLKTMPSYQVIDFVLTKQWDSHSRYEFKIKNLMNKSYEEFDGYGVYARSYYVSFKSHFRL